MISFSNYPEWAHLQAEDAKGWINGVAGNYGASVKRLSYYFVNDEVITGINRAYLQHDYATDIISFGYMEGDLVEGEIYISLETIRNNAKIFGVTAAEELDRVMVHGLLHFMGYNDQTVAERDEMRAEEDNCLLLRPKILNDK